MDFLKGTRVTWLGHATVLVETANGIHLLIDPFIEHNPKYPKSYKLPEKIDYVLVTHAHTDHIADVVPVTKKYGSKVITLFELATYFSGQGVKSLLGMNLGGTVELEGGVSVTMVEARHSSSVSGSETLYVGVAIGFVIHIEGGPVLYHAGDTAVFREMELIQELYAPDVAMLPIGGRYTMGPREAALAVRFLKPKIVLPLHWGTMPELEGTPEQLAALLGDASMVTTVAMVSPGEMLMAK